MLSICLWTILRVTRLSRWTFKGKKEILPVSSLFQVVAEIRRSTFWQGGRRSLRWDADDAEASTWSTSIVLFCQEKTMFAPLSIVQTTPYLPRGRGHRCKRILMTCSYSGHSAFLPISLENR